MRAADRDDVSNFRVGDLEIEVGLQRVVRDGVEIPLPKLSFDLLLVLVRAAPNLVSHAELLARVWPGLIVSDKTVSQRIKLLRDALGDDAEEPRYVASLRGRGYRIVAAVTAIDGAPAPKSAVPEAAHELESSDRRSQPPEGASRPTDALAVRSPFARRAAWIAAGAAAVAVSLLAVLPSRPPAVPPAADSRSAEESAPAVTIAVLPFRAAAGVEADEVVGTGIAEAVLDRLGKVAGIDTIARDSAFKLGADELPLSEIAARLGARYVMEGSVASDGSSLHVAARLVEAPSGAEIWAGEFDRPLAAIFDVQEEITLRSVAALRSPETTPEAEQHRARLTTDVDAYLSYLRGRALLGRRTVVGARQAEAEFEAAIGRDPNFAAALASLYEARLLAADRAGGGATQSAARAFLGDDPLNKVREANRSLIERAIELDPLCGPAYFARAIWAPGHTPERERDFVRGLELDPSNGRGIAAYAEYLDGEGRRDEGERMLARALAVDPLSPRAHFARVMRAFPLDASNLESGMREVLALDPDYQPALQRYAKYRWQFHGELAESARILEHALELDPGNPWLTHTVVAVYLDLGDRAAAGALVAAAERPEIAGDLLIALHDGNTDVADAAAFEDSAFANGNGEAWGVWEAVRDRGLRDRDPSRALAYLGQHTKLLDAPVVVATNNFRAVPAAAHLLLASGRRDEARALLTATIQWIDDYHLPRLSTIYALRVKAAALLLLGETDLALDTLDASFRGGDYLQWWYTLERDPLWSPLRGTPRFEEIRARVARHVEEQRTALAALRLQRIVPIHAAATP